MSGLNDRVQETAAAPGTGAVTLGGAASGAFVPFSSVYANGDTVPVTITDNSANFENAICTYNSGANTLSRNQVLSNSAGTTALINFTGSVNVWVDLPASMAPTMGIAASFAMRTVGR